MLSKNSRKKSLLFLLIFYITICLSDSDAAAQNYREKSYVVAGSFESQKNAVGFSESLNRQGLSVRIAYNSGGKIYYVYTHDSNSKADLLPELKNIKKIPGLENAWIFTGKLVNNYPLTQDRSTGKSTSTFAHPIQSQGSKSRHFTKAAYVVAGSFKSEKNAVGFSQDLNNTGTNAGLVYIPERKFYYVYTLASKDERVLTGGLRSTRKIRGLQHSWIYRAASQENPIGIISQPNPGDPAYVVAGTFSKNVNAAILSETLGMSGIKSDVLYIPEHGLHYVYTMASHSKEVIKRELKKLRAVDGLDQAWILDKEDAINQTGYNSDDDGAIKLSSIRIKEHQDRNAVAQAPERSRKHGLSAGDSYISEQKSFDAPLKGSAAVGKEFENIYGFQNQGGYSQALPTNSTRRETTGDKGRDDIQPEHTGQQKTSKSFVSPPSSAGIEHPSTIADLQREAQGSIGNETSGNAAVTDVDYEGTNTHRLSSHQSNRQSEASRPFSPLKRDDQSDGWDEVGNPARTSALRQPTYEYNNSRGADINSPDSRGAEIRKAEGALHQLKQLAKEANQTVEALTNNSGSSGTTLNTDRTEILRKTSDIIGKTEQSIDQLNVLIQKVYESDEGTETQLPVSKPPAKGINYAKDDVSALLTELIARIDQLLMEVNRIIKEANALASTSRSHEINRSSEDPEAAAEISLEELKHLLFKAAELLEEVNQSISKTERLLERANAPEGIQQNDLDNADEAKEKNETKTPYWASPSGRGLARDERSILISAGFGTATYFGDLKDDGIHIDAKPRLSLAIATFIRPRVSGRMELNYFSLVGSDGTSLNEGKSDRNLSFRSANVELNVSGMLHLLRLGKKFYQRPFLNPYLFMGVGLLYFNPKGKVPETSWQGERLPGAGSYIPLQPLQTENVAYRRFSFVVPSGIGLTCKLTPYINLGLEAGYRITNTDYLDDVSTTYRDHESFKDPLAQAMADKRHEIGLSPLGVSKNHIRGNPTNNDGYFLMSLKIEYYIPPMLGRRW